MPPKDNKRTHLTENIRVELRKIKESNPNWKQKDLVKWLEETHGLMVSQANDQPTSLKKKYR